MSATVDVEDRRFYEHGGIDWGGCRPAAVENEERGHIVQGGSTITQQLVRNLYIGKEVSSTARSKRPASPRSSRTCTRRTGSSRAT